MVEDVTEVEEGGSGGKEKRGEEEGREDRGKEVDT